MGFLGPLLTILAVVGVYFVSMVLWRSRVRAETIVDDTHIGVLIRAGVAVEVVRSGCHSTWLTRDRIEQFDAREQSVVVPGQDLLTSDMLGVKVSMVVRWRIFDAMLYRKSIQNGYSRVYEDVQIELRKRVALTSLDHLTKDRGGLTAGFAEAIGSSLRLCGIEVLAVELRDLSLVGPAKQAFADLWKAQKDGQAALERARGEQASLRALANAARMLKGNPELMNLRLLQVLSASSGKSAPTLVLGGGGGLLPVAPNTGGTEGGTSTGEADA